MTVFVVNRVRYDISPALKFGDFRFINEHYVYGDELDNSNPGYQSWSLPAAVHDRLVQAAEEFSSEADFVLIIGDDLQMVALSAMLAARHASFCVLRWDRKISDYLPVTVHSYLVPPASTVSTTLTNIGENDGEDRRESIDREACAEYRKAPKI